MRVSELELDAEPLCLGDCALELDMRDIFEEEVPTCYSLITAWVA